MFKNTANEIKLIIDSKLSEIISLRNDFEEKEDGSYVSKGDILISNVLKSYFESRYPNYIYISEEDMPSQDGWDSSKSYIFVDPIDGTENFVSGLKEWGVGVSIYEEGSHFGSLIYLPELNDFHFSGCVTETYNSRVVGLSSSINSSDLKELSYSLCEIRIVGCAMYNLLSAARGSFKYFENVKGVNCWDVLPGLNLALEQGCEVFVNDKPYKGEILFPTQKYKVKVEYFGNKND